MAKIETYRDLETWQRAMSLVEEIYRVSRSFPRDERFGLTAQLRRASVSIPSNVAEGWCRRTTNAYTNHVSIALGSHGELETCVEVANRLGYLEIAGPVSRLWELSASTGQLLNGLLRSLEAKLPR